MNETSQASSILPPEQFTGKLLISSEQCVPIRLTARAGSSGRLELNVEPISSSDAPSGVQALVQSYGKLDNTLDRFGLECETSDGKKRLTSDRVYLTGCNPTSDSLHIKLRTEEASLRMTASDTHDRPMLRFWLLGFECSSEVCLETELGPLVVWGTTRTTAPNEIIGWIAARGPDGCQPLSWRKAAEHMLKHLRSVLGFARGAPLPVLLSEFYEGDTVEVTFHETGEGYPSMRPLLPHQNLGPIVEAAVSNIEAVDKHRDAFELAVGWLLVPTTFEEVRFLVGMTALESLAWQLLKKSQMRILGSSKSDKFAKRVRALIEEQKDFDDSTKEAIKDKIPELNRRSFIQNIRSLLKQQQVARTLVDDAELARLVKLRNTIVHKGSAREDKSLLPSILIIREIVVRLVFSMLQFDGTYQCYIGGSHRRRFPDCGPVN